VKARLVTAILLMIGLTSLAIGLYQSQADEMLKLIGDILGACRAGLP